MKKILISLLALSAISANASTCKIKTIKYADDWLSSEMRQSIEQKGYDLSPSFEENEVDYVLKYHLSSAGVYPCGPFWCTGNKRFAAFSIEAPNSTRKPLIQIEIGSKKKEFTELRNKIEQKALTKIQSKLPFCKP